MLNLTEVSVIPHEPNPASPALLLPASESPDPQRPTEAAFAAILGELIGTAFLERPIGPTEEEEQRVQAPENTSQANAAANVAVLPLPSETVGSEETVTEQPDPTNAGIGTFLSLVFDGHRPAEAAVAEPSRNGTGLPKLVGPYALKTGHQQTVSSGLERLLEKYDVRKIEFAFERTAPDAGQSAVGIESGFVRQQAPGIELAFAGQLAVGIDPALARQALASVKPAAVQQLVITDAQAGVGHHEGRPAVLSLAHGNVDDSSQHQERPPDTLQQEATVSLTAPPQPDFRIDVEKAESVRSLPDIELPPPPPMARRLSMEIGEADSQLMVTIRERNGDLTLHFDAGNKTLRHNLEASVDSLVHVFERENLRLTDVAFNSFGSATDAEQQSPDQRSRRGLKQGALFADEDETYQFHHAASILKSNEIAS